MMTSSVAVLAQSVPTVAGALVQAMKAKTAKGLAKAMKGMAGEATIQLNLRAFGRRWNPYVRHQDRKACCREFAALKVRGDSLTRAAFEEQVRELFARYTGVRCRATRNRRARALSRQVGNETSVRLKLPFKAPRSSAP